MTSKLLEEELEELPKRLTAVPNTQLITCHRSMVQIKVRKTAHKQIVVCAQFPDGYPACRLLLELKSKTIPDKLLEKLVTVCDQEVDRNLGKKQVMVVVNFLSDFISSNPFIVCSDELSYIKKQLLADCDELKVKQKTGSLHYVARQGRYFVDFVLTVPHEYPAKHIQFEMKSSNLPEDILRVCKGHVAEISRQCVEPPLRRKPTDPVFEPRPSLQAVADFVVKDTIRKYPVESCPYCREAALPKDPKDVVREETNPQFLYRVYCGHCYHRKCLDVYTKTPPFAGGKKCLACQQRIFHDKWNIAPRLAEDRWAHHEARKREIDEVADFLGV